MALRVGCTRLEPTGPRVRQVGSEAIDSITQIAGELRHA